MMLMSFEWTGILPLGELMLVSILIDLNVLRCRQRKLHRLTASLRMNPLAMIESARCHTTNTLSQSDNEVKEFLVRITGV